MATQAAQEGIDYAKRVNTKVICVFSAEESPFSIYFFKPEFHWPTDNEYKQAVTDTSKSLAIITTTEKNEYGLIFWHHVVALVENEHFLAVLLKK